MCQGHLVKALWVVLGLNIPQSNNSRVIWFQRIEADASQSNAIAASRELTPNTSSTCHCALIKFLSSFLITYKISERVYYIYFFTYVGDCTHAHVPHHPCEVRKQLMGVSLYHVGPRDQIQVLTFGSKCLYPLIHLTSLLAFSLPPTPFCFSLFPSWSVSRRPRGKQKFRNQSKRLH